MSRSQTTSERDSLESTLYNLARRPWIEIDGELLACIKNDAYKLTQSDCQKMSPNTIVQLSAFVFDENPYRLDNHFLQWICPYLTPAAAYAIAANAIHAGDKAVFQSMLTIEPSVEVEPYAEQFRRFYPHASAWMESNPSLIHAALSVSKVSYALEVLQYQFSRCEQASMTFHQFALNEIEKLVKQSTIQLGDQCIVKSIDVLALAIAIDGLPQTMEFIIHEHASQLAVKATQQIESIGISLSTEAIACIMRDARLSIERESKYAMQVNLEEVFHRVICAGETACVKRLINMPELYTNTIPYSQRDPYFWATSTKQADVLAELLKSCRLSPNRTLSEEAQERGERKTDEFCRCLYVAVEKRDAEMLGIILSSDRIELHYVVSSFERMQWRLDEIEPNDDDRLIHDMLRACIERRSRALTPAVSQIQRFWQRHHKSTAIEAQDHTDQPALAHVAQCK